MKNHLGWGQLAAAGVVGATLLNGCGSSSTSDNTTAQTTTTIASAPAATEAPTPTEAPQHSFTGAPVKPPAGMGNAQGRVLWNEKPAVGVEVKLCQDISFINGCGGKTFSAKTDKDGNYTIDAVKPGDYGLAVRVFNTDNFVYPTSGNLTAAKYHVEAGKTLDIRATNLFKTDLQTLSPKAGEVVKISQPKLTWKPYPNAATYEVTLAGKGSESQTFKTAATSGTPETPLLNGPYDLKIVARNANDIKIAQTSSATPFKVTGQAGSSQVTLLTPAPDAAVGGTGIKFSWKPHPVANGYQIYLNPASTNAGASKGPILAFEKIDGTTYTLAQTLPHGQYFWSITATHDGQKVAASDLVPFRVK